MTKIKKSLSLILVLAMIFSLGATSFAATTATVDYGFDWQYVDAYDATQAAEFDGDDPELVQELAAVIEAAAQDYFTGGKATIVPGTTTAMDVMEEFLTASGLDANTYGGTYLSDIIGLGDGFKAGVSAGIYSGWMYKVNDVYPSVGASQYVLTDGDTVRWVYVTDYTEIDWDWGTAPASLAEAQR